MLHISVQTWTQPSSFLILDLGLNLFLVFEHLSNGYKLLSLHILLYSLCLMQTPAILLTVYASLFFEAI